MRWIPLALAVALVIFYAILARRFAPWFIRSPWAAWLVLLPLGVIVWALVHASGVHATVAGVLLAFAVPVRAGTRSSEEPIDLAGVFAHRFGPISSWIAVPVFAFFAAGVSIAGESRFPLDPIAIGVMLGLILGKPLGIALSTWLLTRFTRAELGEASWRELIGVACLGGVGFTVSLLISELSFSDAADADTAKLAVMAGSVAASALAATFLVRRARPRRPRSPR